MKQILLLKRSVLDFEIVKKISFVFIFFAQLSYYLLILQTAVIPIYESNFLFLSVIPFGGILGMLFSSLFKNKIYILKFALFSQFFMMLFYPNYSFLDLFALGFLSGITVPVLLFMLDELFLGVFSLALSYSFSTFFIGVDIYDRKAIALFLSFVAFFFSFFYIPQVKSSFQKPDFKKAFEIFLWIFLDSLLFEALIRSNVGIWGKEDFLYSIVFFHIIGVFLGYLFINKKFFLYLLAGLFVLSYLFFVTKNQYLLSFVYPIAISMYNVRILNIMRKMSFNFVSVFSILLWTGSCAGLFTAINLYKIFS